MNVEQGTGSHCLYTPPRPNRPTQKDVLLINNTGNHPKVSRYSKGTRLVSSMFFRCISRLGVHGEKNPEE